VQCTFRHKAINFPLNTQESFRNFTTFIVDLRWTTVRKPRIDAVATPTWISWLCSTGPISWLPFLIGNCNDYNFRLASSIKLNLSGIQEAENEKCGNHRFPLTSKLDFSRGESEIEFTSEARATAWTVPTAKVGESATA
jgi:hypothetical protein